MAKEIEIYVHGEGSSAKLLRVAETAALKELYSEAKLSPVAEKVFFYIEDGDVELEGEMTVQHHRLLHRGHIHCHRCRKIHVTVTFNNVSHEKEFTPATTGKKILKWALKEFKVDGVTHKLVIAGTTTELKADDHVGSFTKYPHCALALQLVPDTVVQG